MNDEIRILIEEAKKAGYTDAEIENIIALKLASQEQSDSKPVAPQEVANMLPWLPGAQQDTPKPSGGLITAYGDAFFNELVYRMPASFLTQQFIAGRQESFDSKLVQRFKDEVVGYTYLNRIRDVEVSAAPMWAKTGLPTRKVRLPDLPDDVYLKLAKAYYFPKDGSTKPSIEQLISKPEQPWEGSEQAYMQAKSEFDTRLQQRQGRLYHQITSLRKASEALTSRHPTTYAEAASSGVPGITEKMLSDVGMVAGQLPMSLLTLGYGTFASEASEAYHEMLENRAARLTELTGEPWSPERVIEANQDQDALKYSQMVGAVNLLLEYVGFTTVAGAVIKKLGRKAVVKPLQDYLIKRLGPILSATIETGSFGALVEAGTEFTQEASLLYISQLAEGKTPAEALKYVAENGPRLREATLSGAVGGGFFGALGGASASALGAKTTDTQQAAPKRPQEPPAPAAGPASPTETDVATELKQGLIEDELSDLPSQVATPEESFDQELQKLEELAKAAAGLKDAQNQQTTQQQEGAVAQPDTQAIPQLTDEPVTPATPESTAASQVTTTQEGPQTSAQPASTVEGAQQQPITTTSEAVVQPGALTQTEQAPAAKLTAEERRRKAESNRLQKEFERRQQIENPKRRLRSLTQFVNSTLTQAQFPDAHVALKNQAEAAIAELQQQLQQPAAKAPEAVQNVGNQTAAQERQAIVVEDETTDVSPAQQLDDEIQTLEFEKKNIARKYEALRDRSGNVLRRAVPMDQWAQEDLDQVETINSQIKELQERKALLAPTTETQPQTQPKTRKKRPAVAEALSGVELRDTPQIVTPETPSRVQEPQGQEATQTEPQTKRKTTATKRKPQLATKLTKDELQPRYRDAVVVQTEEELPADLRSTNEYQQAKGRVQGVYWRGQVYLVADNLSSIEEADRKYRHEATGHRAFQMHFAEQADQIALEVVENATDEQRQVMESLIQRYRMKPLSELNEAEKTLLGHEYLAYIAENSKDHPTLWQQIVAKFQEVLRKLGWRDNISDAEIRMMLDRARRSYQAKFLASQPDPSARVAFGTQTLLNEILRVVGLKGDIYFSLDASPVSGNVDEYHKVRWKEFKKVYKRDNVVKVIRDYAPPIYKYYQEGLEFLQNYIPIKSHIVPILTRHGGFVSREFLSRLSSKGVLTDEEKLITQHSSPYAATRELVKKIDAEFLQIQDFDTANTLVRHYYEGVGSDGRIGGSIICTLGSPSAFEHNLIFFVIQNNATEIPRATVLTQDNLTEEWKAYLKQQGRQRPDGSFDLSKLKPNIHDPFSLSVLLIKIHKVSGAVNIVSRYNHDVPGCNTVFDHLDDIVTGLEYALTQLAASQNVFLHHDLGDSFTLYQDQLFYTPMMFSEFNSSHRVKAGDGVVLPAMGYNPIDITIVKPEEGFVLGGLIVDRKKNIVVPKNVDLSQDIRELRLSDRDQSAFTIKDILWWQRENNEVTFKARMALQSAKQYRYKNIKDLTLLATFRTNFQTKSPILVDVQFENMDFQTQDDNIRSEFLSMIHRQLQPYRNRGSELYAWFKAIPFNASWIWQTLDNFDHIITHIGSSLDTVLPISVHTFDIQDPVPFIAEPTPAPINTQVRVTKVPVKTINKMYIEASDRGSHEIILPDNTKIKDLHIYYRVTNGAVVSNLSDFVKITSNNLQAEALRVAVINYEVPEPQTIIVEPEKFLPGPLDQKTVLIDVVGGPPSRVTIKINSTKLPQRIGVISSVEGPDPVLIHLNAPAVTSLESANIQLGVEPYRDGNIEFSYNLPLVDKQQREAISNQKMGVRVVDRSDEIPQFSLSEPTPESDAEIDAYVNTLPDKEREQLEQLEQRGLSKKLVLKLFGDNRSSIALYDDPEILTQLQSEMQESLTPRDFYTLRRAGLMKDVSKAVLWRMLQHSRNYKQLTFTEFQTLLTESFGETNPINDLVRALLSLSAIASNNPPIILTGEAADAVASPSFYASALSDGQVVLFFVRSGNAFDNAWTVRHELAHLLHPGFEPMKQLVPGFYNAAQELHKQTAETLYKELIDIKKAISSGTGLTPKQEALLMCIRAQVVYVARRSGPNLAQRISTGVFANIPLIELTTQYLGKLLSRSTPGSTDVWVEQLYPLPYGLSNTSEFIAESLSGHYFSTMLHILSLNDNLEPVGNNKQGSLFTQMLYRATETSNKLNNLLWKSWADEHNEAVRNFLVHAAINPVFTPNQASLLTKVTELVNKEFIQRQQDFVANIRELMRAMKNKAVVNEFISSTGVLNPQDGSVDSTPFFSVGSTNQPPSANPTGQRQTTQLISRLFRLAMRHNYTTAAQLHSFFNRIQRLTGQPIPPTVRGAVVTRVQNHQRNMTTASNLRHLVQQFVDLYISRPMMGQTGVVPPDYVNIGRALLNVDPNRLSSKELGRYVRLMLALITRDHKKINQGLKSFLIPHVASQRIADIESKENWFEFRQFKNHLGKFNMADLTDLPTFVMYISNYSKKWATKLMQYFHDDLAHAYSRAQQFTNSLIVHLNDLAFKHNLSNANFRRIWLFGQLMSEDPTKPLTLQEKFQKLREMLEVKKFAAQHGELYQESVEDVEQEIDNLTEIYTALVNGTDALTDGEMAYYNEMRRMLDDLEEAVRVNAEIIHGTKFVTIRNYVPTVVIGAMPVKVSVSPTQFVTSGAMGSQSSLLNVTPNNIFRNVLTVGQSAFQLQRTGGRGVFYNTNVHSVMAQYLNSVAFDMHAAYYVRVLNAMFTGKNKLALMENLGVDNTRRLFNYQREAILYARRGAYNLKPFVKALLELKNTLATAKIGTSGQFVSQLLSMVPAIIAQNGYSNTQEALQALIIYYADLHLQQPSQTGHNIGILLHKSANVTIRNFFMEKYESAEDVAKRGIARGLQRAKEKADRITTAVMTRSDKIAYILNYLAALKRAGVDFNDPTTWTQERISEADMMATSLQNISSPLYIAPVLRMNEGNALMNAALWSFKSFALHASMNAILSAPDAIRGRGEAGRVFKSTLISGLTYELLQTLVVRKSYAAVGIALLNALGFSLLDDDEPIDWTKQLTNAFYGTFFGGLPSIADSVFRYIAGAMIETATGKPQDALYTPASGLDAAARGLGLYLDPLMVTTQMIDLVRDIALNKKISKDRKESLINKAVVQGIYFSPYILPLPIPRGDVAKLYQTATTDDARARRKYKRRNRGKQLKYR